MKPLLLLLCATLAVSAQEPATDAVKALKDSPPTAETLAKAVSLLADPAGRSGVRLTILSLDPFPSAELTGLLSHADLAVRLGALELLEEKSGGDFGFNPWASLGSPENEGPLARWKQWAGEKPGTASKKDLFGDEQRRGYLHDLLANDADKSARARRMLEADGLGAVGFLETFLANSPTLPTGSRAKVREAQYQIVLSRPLGPQAATTARQLSFGSRDQTLAALGTLRSSGLVALPILRDFLQHTDPLVRETAIDAMLSAGGAQSLPVVGPVLTAETDVNVIHGALRRLKEIPGDPSLKLAASFLSHEDEDLLVSAIQACLKLAGGNENEFMFSSGERKPKVEEGVKAEVNQAIVKALSDPRWRVRTAALEFVAGRKVAEAKTRCVELLSDPDEFVRFSAIKAAAALGAEGASEKLKEMFLADAGMVGPVLEGYAALSKEPDAAMVEKLGTYPPDARLAAIRAAESDSDLADVVIRFANDPDLDVSCAAIRFLSSDADRVKTPEVASVLVAALRSNSEEKRAAALDRLVVPPVSGKQPDPALELAVKPVASGEKTALDPLYDALLKAAGQQAKAPAAQIDVIPGAQRELVKALNAIAAETGENSFRAALCLARAGDPGGLVILTTRLAQLSTAQRAAIAEQLYQPTRKEALELLRLLLRDPIEEIRGAAAGSTLSNSNSPAFLTMLLEELAAPGAKLQPHEVYTYHFESAARDGRLATTLRSWALNVIREPKSPGPLSVLAFIALRQNFPASAAEPTLALAKGSSDRWVRRAAWDAMGANGAAAFRQNLAILADDPAPQVRAVLADASGRMRSAWMHRFDDTRSMENSSWYSSRESRRLFPEAKAALEKMAATDPDETIRFESMFALLSQGQTIDVDAFAALISRQPEEAAASYRLSDWMGDNAGRLGAGLAPIVAALDSSKVQPEKMQSILLQIAPKKDNDGGGFASFAALVAGAEAVAAAPQQTAVEEKEEEKPARESLKVVYFFKPGCAECEKASQLLEAVKADFPLLQVEKHNINETDGTVLNQALCSRFQVPSNKHTIAPAIFSQAGFLVREDIAPQALGGLLSSTMSKAQDDSWSVIERTEIAAAQEVVQERFEGLTLPVVLAAGLIDGINPCAFATIIFFLSYLQIARRTPREMLMVGAAFILAVFLAYFLAGLVLHKVLAQVTDRIAGIKPWLDWIFGGLALVAAFLSFRDALKARAGRLDEMSLQLPGFLKDRIRGVIRTGARARRFVIGAFFAGLAISFLELACTGQVYAPIIYHIQQGRMDAVAWLLAYNLAFIVPLIVIFALAFSGMTSNTLIAFQTKHTFAVKVALGLVFIALAWVIIFGQKMLHA